jgi:4-hydroxy-3-polyprenylbenzoate decarboxylase
MYRVQLSGGEYLPDREIGLHYQIHRGIGNHHARALALGRPLRVSIFVGGPPAHTLAAVMPLPEAMPEVAFAGALAGRRFRYLRQAGATLSADADFCITGWVVPGRTKPEGPFGDHLGYYSLVHDFPYLEVDGVFHRKGAVWPFTVVGRPPREDSVFGRIIHDITGSAVTRAIPGVTAIHAVDAAGVHPLLLAKARERYVPYGRHGRTTVSDPGLSAPGRGTEARGYPEPQAAPGGPAEILTVANAILGTGQLSLAKYLVICSHEDDPTLDIHDVPGFFTHVLERIDLRTGLHFHTCATMDTLDYSGGGLNQGSKVVMAAAGERQRTLARGIAGLPSFPAPFFNPLSPGPGILVVGAPAFQDHAGTGTEIAPLLGFLGEEGRFRGFPLVVLADDPAQASRDFDTFLWITFTRSNPSHDIHGAGGFTRFKHWGCDGPLVIDARIKPFHAPPLVPDPSVAARVEQLGKRGGDLYGII